MISSTFGLFFHAQFLVSFSIFLPVFAYLACMIPGDSRKDQCCLQSCKLPHPPLSFAYSPPPAAFPFSLFPKLVDAQLIGFIEHSLSKYSSIQRNLLFCCGLSDLIVFLFHALFGLSCAYSRPFLAGKQNFLLPVSSGASGPCPLPDRRHGMVKIRQLLTFEQ